MDSFTATLSQSAELLAPRLLGGYIERLIHGQKVIGKIVETEAYDQTDTASHCYRGKTPRTEIMFGPAGYLYVYFTYGMHYCMNIVTGEVGQGSAVLIRAIEPIAGIDSMMKNRGGKTGVELTNGPAKTCQALGIDRQFNGHNLRVRPIKLILKPPLNTAKIVQTTRIGISQAKDIPWRFYIKGNEYVSKP